MALGPFHATAWRNMRESSSEAEREDAQPRARVLFINHAGEIGGAELILLDTAHWYRRTSSVLLLADGPFRGRLEEAGVPVQVLEGTTSLHSFRRSSVLPSSGTILSVLQIARRIARRARDYDLIYANSQKAFVISCAAAMLARRPLIWHLHDILSREHFSRTNLRLGVALANRVAARIIAISRATASAFVEQGGREKKVKIVYNGIDSVPFRSLTRAQVEAARAEMGWGPTPVLGCFSRIAPWKGQHVVLEALPKLPGVHAVFVGGTLFGEQAYGEQLHETASVLGISDRVQFLGARDDVPRLMQLVDVIAHTPISAEPFGRVVVEAMFAEKPLVASRTGGIVEIIDEGVNGLMFTTGDADELTSKIGTLLERRDWASSLGRAAREHASTHFSLKAMLRGITWQIEEVARP